MRRALAIILTVGCVLLLPGCLDEKEQGSVQTAIDYINGTVPADATQAHPGVLAVRGLQDVLDQSSTDWGWFESLMGLVGIGGVVSIGAIQRALVYRRAAHDIAQRFRDDGNGTFILPKSSLTDMSKTAQRVVTTNTGNGA